MKVVLHMFMSTVVRYMSSSSAAKYARQMVGVALDHRMGTMARSGCRGTRGGAHWQGRPFELQVSKLGLKSVVSVS